ncbi:MAG TPA: peptidoglycan-binding protein [Candidatus Sulfotelmatobacter sp.]|nr:peptidoglycan-binding protein [Candidatus Sulfotelmatobacter sp.]
MNLGTRTRNISITAALAVLLMCVLAFPADARAAGTSGSAPSAAKAKTKKHSSASAKTRTTSSKRRKKSRVRGQEKIDSARAQAIQAALIREHYLSGEATGKWDQASEDAMRRYQQNNGWQDKTVPDSRALIKLGLGPSKDHLLNPESAMTTVPDPPKADPVPTTSHSSPAVANPPQTAAPTSTPVSSDSSQPQ